MPDIVLEFEKLEILRPRERWKLYFIIVSDHPDKRDKMLVANIPAEFIRLKPKEDNQISFKPRGDSGTDGLIVMQSRLPASRRITVRAYLRHSRQSTRDVGKFMTTMKDALGENATGIISGILGTTNPWLEIAKKVFPIVGDIISEIRDRDFGFISLDEEFGDEFGENKKLKRINNFSTGEARLTWAWSLQARPGKKSRNV